MTRIPRHIAIIMDGNGRWATERNKPRSYGHQAGVETVRRITSECVRLGVKYLTLYTFSTENWNRPTDEIAALMGLVLPEEVQEKLRETEQHTEKNAAMTMVVALSYSARWEITQAMKEIVTEHQQENAVPLRPEMITEELLDRHMQTNFMPDPDLLIRTGGELRISNYLLWQIAYSANTTCRKPSRASRAGSDGSERQKNK